MSQQELKAIEYCEIWDHGVLKIMVTKADWDIIAERITRSPSPDQEALSQMSADKRAKMSAARMALIESMSSEGPPSEVARLREECANLRKALEPIWDQVKTDSKYGEYIAFGVVDAQIDGKMLEAIRAALAPPSQRQGHQKGQEQATRATGAP